MVDPDLAGPSSGGPVALSARICGKGLHDDGTDAFRVQPGGATRARRVLFDASVAKEDESPVPQSDDTVRKVEFLYELVAGLSLSGREHGLIDGEA